MSWVSSIRSQNLSCPMSSFHYFEVRTTWNRRVTPRAGRISAPPVLLEVTERPVNLPAKHERCGYRRPIVLEQVTPGSRTYSGLFRVYTENYRGKVQCMVKMSCTSLFSSLKQHASHKGIIGILVTFNSWQYCGRHGTYAPVVRGLIARKYTVILAVCGMRGDSEWDLEMELHMNMDFGSAKGTYENRTTVPLDWTVQHELEERKPRSEDVWMSWTFQRILTVSTGCFSTLGTPSKILAWELFPVGTMMSSEGALETCSSPRFTVKNKGFTFDVRVPGSRTSNVNPLFFVVNRGKEQITDPASAIRTVHDLTQIEEVRGKSVNNMLTVGRGGNRSGPSTAILIYLALLN